MESKHTPLKEKRMSQPDLQSIACFLLDMDGTVFLDEHLLPGAVELPALLDRRGIPYLFLTNNSSKHRGQYAEKLQRLGLQVSPERIFTSGEATAIYLQRRQPAAKLYVVGTPALEEEMASHGFQLTAHDPEFAVLGFDTTLTYEKLRVLCNLVRAGQPYIATHPDINCPTAGGFMPDIGAMIELVAASTGRRPDVIIGKPGPVIARMAAEKVGLPPEKLCMVGDRLYTDIALGQAGLTTVLVLSGETKASDVPASPFQPDFIVPNLAGLVELLSD